MYIPKPNELFLTMFLTIHVPQFYNQHQKQKVSYSVFITKKLKFIRWKANTQICRAEADFHVKVEQKQKAKSKQHFKSSSNHLKMCHTPVILSQKPNFIILEGSSAVKGKHVN